MVLKDGYQLSEAKWPDLLVDRNLTHCTLFKTSFNLTEMLSGWKLPFRGRGLRWQKVYSNLTEITTIRMKYLIENIIQQLIEVQNGKLWIGGNFESKLNQVDENSAFLRPNGNLHSVAEIISHLTLWRKETILKIQTGKGSKTDDCEENWLDNNKLKTLGWDKIRSDYDRTLLELIELLKLKEDDFLKELYYDTDYKGNYEFRFVINGMLHHDIYHLGQLGIIIKRLKESKKI